MIYYHTSPSGRRDIPKSKIAVTLETSLLARVDRLVNEGAYPNRSQAIEHAVHDQLARLDRTRLVRECAKLDPAFERNLASEGLDADADAWPAY